MIYKLNGIEPKFDENCYVADTASVIGRVFTGKNVSVWFSAVVRGDVCDIRIGDRSNRIMLLFMVIKITMLL